MRAALVGLASRIVMADLAQVAFLGKGMGAIAGAMVYGMIAILVAGAGRGRIRLGAGVGPGRFATGPPPSNLPQPTGRPQFLHIRLLD